MWVFPFVGMMALLAGDPAVSSYLLYCSIFYFSSFDSKNTKNERKKKYTYIK
jgi:hypothetical protein